MIVRACRNGVEISEKKILASTSTPLCGHKIHFTFHRTNIFDPFVVYRARCAQDGEEMVSKISPVPFVFLPAPPDREKSIVHEVAKRKRHQSLLERLALVNKS